MKYILNIIIFSFLLTVLINGQNISTSICQKRTANWIKQSELKNPDQYKYDVKNYKIELEINPDSRSLNGEVTIHFESLENGLQKVMLNLAGLQIDSVKQGIDIIDFTRQQNELTVDLVRPVDLFNLDSLQIYYQGVPTKGMYFRTGRYSNSVIYTHNEPFDAQYWFPCKDIPSDKAYADIVITLPNSYEVGSNGILKSKSVVNPDKMMFHWSETYPISTYLISIAASNYDIVTNSFEWEGNQLPLEYYVYPQDRNRGESALTNTIEMLQFFSDYIGFYPFILEKYAMTEVPFQEAGAMENQTISTMDEPIIDNENVIAHELAHQWWGDAVTLATFADIWLNEGFATYFNALFLENKYGQQVFQETMVLSGSYARSDASIQFPIYDPPMQYLFGNAVYHKGAWVLHMLRMKMGDTDFKAAISEYYNHFQYGNATTADFISVCEAISGQTLTKFFDQWVFNAGIPNIFATWNQQNNEVNITLDQLQTQTIYNFDLEIMLKGVTKDTVFTINLNEKSQNIKIVFSEPITQLIIDPETKVLNVNNSPVYSIPSISRLLKLYPNPFNNELKIFYNVEKLQQIKIELWNIRGEKIKTLMDEEKTIGTHQLIFTADEIASGTYICVLRSESNTDTHKVMLIK